MIARQSPGGGWTGASPYLRSRRLSGWADGYTAGTQYIDQINVDLSPAWFSMISVLNGQPPLDTTRPLVWLDIACGTGLAACSVAAGNPDVEVWGIDYNPTHIDRAQSLARSSGLDNCHFVEASFEDLANNRTVGPSEADVVVVNGVYSWISSQNRERIVATIGQRLRAGGLAHIMYESATGWSSMNPIAEALRLHVDADGRAGHDAFHDAAEVLLALRDNGAGYFPIGSRETAQMDTWRDANPQYAAHEYLGAHFAPLMVDDVSEAMNRAKCTLLGTIGPLDHHPYYSVPPDFADLLGDATDPLAREMLRDLVLQTPLRRDLYRRGRAAASSGDQMAWTLDLRVRGVGKPFEDKPLALPAMQVTLNPAYHVPLTEALGEKDLDVAAIREIHPGWTVADATTAIGLLVAAGYATPMVAGGPTERSVAACRRFNETLLRERSRGWTHSCLADPSSGAMQTIDLVEAIALDGIWIGLPAEVPDLVEMVEGVFAQHNRVVREEGRLIHESDESRTIVERRVAALLERRPALQRLGIDLIDPQPLRHVHASSVGY